jgi:protein tyrosine phosphatase (PTP) superfamily phosphohydrolase (DUF442 family)
MGPLAKLAECRYCQMFWMLLGLSVVINIYGMPKWLGVIVFLLAAHRIAQFFWEFFDRYMNRAPMEVNLHGLPPMPSVLDDRSPNPAESRIATSTGKPLASRIQVNGIKNFAQVAKGIYRGAQPNAEGLKYLSDNGFKTIISFREWHCEKLDPKLATMEAISIPIEADIFGSEPPTETQIKRFFEVIMDKGELPVFFHCMQGVDRTGVMAALYRIEIDGWTNKEAIEEMQAFGFHDMWKDLMEFIRSYKRRGYGRSGT